jgi:hypothetical protein
MSDQSAPSLGNVKLSAKRKRPHTDSDAEDGDQMCATDARKAYNLKDQDLHTLKCDLVPNPYDLHGASAPMRLYKVSDLRVSPHQLQSVRRNRAVCILHSFLRSTTATYLSHSD